MCALVALLALASLTGCFGGLAKRLADREAYPLLARKQKEALGVVRPFTIEPTTSTLTREVVAKAGYAADQFTTDGLTLSLSDALELAVENSWPYQSRKEDVYLAALRLTEAQHVFSPIYSGTIAAQAVREPGATPGQVERFGSLATDLGMTRLFASGARVTVGLTNNFLRYYTGPPREEATGLLTASIVQPLLRGAGTRVTLENLRQADRDVIYAIRAFARYRQQFVVDRTSDYLRLLQAWEEIENEHASYDRLVLVRQRAEAMAEAQRMEAYEVDQARQNEIRAKNRWLNTQTDYARRLDQFRVNLGLPPTLKLQPNMEELRRLQEAGLVELPLTLAEAQELALARRLDLMNIKAQAEDAERKLEIAENSLLPVLNAGVDLAVPNEGRNRPLDPDWRARTRTARLDLELPLDRKVERNSYRAALIELERRRRATEQLSSQVVAEVRDAYRNVEEARKTFELQQAGFKLARKRVDLIAMMMEVGREDVNIRDQIDAEDDLRDARANMVEAVVQYTLARLQLYNATEQLEIDEQGAWHEDTKAKS